LFIGSLIGGVLELKDILLMKKQDFSIEEDIKIT
jgi:hypothetical protein